MTFKENLLWIKKLTSGFRGGIITNILLGTTSVGLSLLFVYLSKKLVDSAVNGGIDGGLLMPSLEIGGVLIVQQIIIFFRGRIDNITSTKMMNLLREKLFNRVMLSRWDGKERFHTGDITNRFDGDLRKVCETICTKFPEMMITAVEFSLSFLFMLSLDSRLAWLLFFIMPLSLLFSKRYMLRMRRLTHSIRKVDSKIQSHIQEQVQYRNMVNSMGHAGNSIKALQLLGEQLFLKTMRRTNYSLYSKNVVRFGFNIGYLTAFLWGVDGLSSGTISFGVMTAFLQLVAKVQLPVVEISSYLSTIAQTSSSVERLAELDRLEIEQQGEQKLLYGEVGVKLSNVGFNYDGREVLSDFYYDFTPNKLHIIVGETGSGKSTLLRLMLGFLSPKMGSIDLYNGKEIVKCSPLTRANFVYVPQGNSLISGTIRENILLGDPTASEEKIKEVLHIAAADFVYNLEAGLDTVCGERGAGLSEGEAQRIAIARGLLRKGGVFLLDEPTSALDSVTEKILIERLKSYAKNHTLIMVTHRERCSEMFYTVVKLNKSK